MKRALMGVALVLGGLISGPAFAADKIKVVSTLKGFWDTTLVDFGRQKGIFRDAGLDLDIVFSQSGSDVLQTVIAGGADVGVGTGTAGALAAVTKGAPLVIVGSEFTGASELTPGRQNGARQRQGWGEPKNEHVHFDCGHVHFGVSVRSTSRRGRFAASLREEIRI